MQDTPSGTERSDPVAAFVAMGSNVGERAAHLRRAVAWLAEHPLIEIVAASPVYETRAHTLQPGEEAPDFLNAVLHLRTSLTPEELLLALHEVERAMGRDRGREPRWAPRALDLDLLLYGGQSIRGPDLVVPHPRMGVRRFVLQPLVDVAPDVFVPEPFGGTARELLDRCPDPDLPVRTAHRIR